MKTITRILMLAILMLAVANVYAQKGDNPLKKKIQAYNNQIVKAILEGDHEKSLSFYTREAISLPNYGKMLRGLEDISGHQREAEAMGNKITAMTLSTKKVAEYGDALVEVGVYTITLEIKSMPEPISDVGKYLTVWEKQADGSYKMAYEIWNTDVNPMMKMMKSDKPMQEKPSDRLIKQEGQTKSGSEAPKVEKKKN